MKCPKCGSLRWFIHDEASGIGAKTCMGCGFNTTAVTEFELFNGIPIKENTYARLNAISRKSRLSCPQKSAFYRKNKGRMKRTYRKSGDVGVLTTYPIHISTWGRLKKEWGLVPLTDRRKNNRFRPTGRQLILV